MTQAALSKHLGARAVQIDAFLSAYLDELPQNGEIDRPKSLINAMRHGVLNGGKRLRPFLMLEIAAMLGGNDKLALHAAAALECLHCYSLIHDDLPAMDDDDLRRGKPTVHIAYDEATAILAGDALLTMAFELTGHELSGLDAETRISLVTALARDAGIGGMVGGQQFDLENENRTVDEAMITRIHAMKTGALIRYACEAGALIGAGDREDTERLRRYGEVLGLAFQLADDLLDVTSDVAKMGKATGKDAQAGKNTQVALHGVDWAKARLNELVSEAESLLEPYGDRAELLRATAHFVAKRDH